MKKREKLFSLTKKDFKWTTFKSSGPGGQHKNKTMSGSRCVHEPSGAIGQASELRKYHQNRKIAFKRMAATKEFKEWVRLKGLKMMGVIDRIEKEIHEEMKQSQNIRVEIKDKDGRWVEIV